MKFTYTVEADTLFVDADNGDFRLKENSPAAKVDCSDRQDVNNSRGGCYLGAFPADTSKESFWWTANFPPVIDIKSYPVLEW